MNRSGCFELLFCWKQIWNIYTKATKAQGFCFKKCDTNKQTHTHTHRWEPVWDLLSSFKQGKLQYLLFLAASLQSIQIRSFFGLLPHIRFFLTLKVGGVREGNQSYMSEQQWRTQEFFRGWGSTNSAVDRRQRERGSRDGSPLVRSSNPFANEWTRILIRLLRMYFPRNWEIGSALSKLRNFGGGEQAQRS
jgi:hypothetical protein